MWTPVLPLFANQGQMWRARVHHSVLLLAKFRLHCYMLSPGENPRGLPRYLTKFSNLKLLYPAPFTDQGQIWHARVYSQSTLTCQSLSGSVYYVAQRDEKLPNIKVFTARRNARIASAVLATAIPSVCLFVCPSVTRRYCVKTTARSKVQFALLDSKMCLVL